MGINTRDNAGMDMAAYMELLEIYMDLVERQDTVIHGLTGVVKKQATEIHHLRSVFGVTSIPSGENIPREVREELESYQTEMESMINP